MMKFIGRAFLIIIAISAIGGILSKLTQRPENPEDRARRLAHEAAWADERRMEEEAQRRVLARLRDPDSAQWGFMTSRDLAVCGSVNARNGFGGYNGYQLFVVADGQVLFQSDPGFLSLFGRCGG